MRKERGESRILVIARNGSVTLLKTSCAHLVKTTLLGVAKEPVLRFWDMEIAGGRAYAVHTPDDAFVIVCFCGGHPEWRAEGRRKKVCYGSPRAKESS